MGYLETAKIHAAKAKEGLRYPTPEQHLQLAIYNAIMAAEENAGAAASYASIAASETERLAETYRKRSRKVW